MHPTFGFTANELALNILFCPCLMQAKGGKQMFGRSWGRLEAELAHTLHQTFSLVAQHLPWDAASDTAAFRHMPEARISRIAARHAQGFSAQSLPWFSLPRHSCTCYAQHQKISLIL